MDTDYFGGNAREWPAALSNLVNDLDEPLPKPKAEFELALSSLGAIIWYLRECLIDVSLITMRKLDLYQPTTLQSQIDVSLTITYTQPINV